MKFILRMLSGALDAVLLDLSKAFHMVPYQRLSIKLSPYGISRNMLQWIQSFLSNISQQVHVEGHFSSSVPVTSGVPLIRRKTTQHEGSTPLVSDLPVAYEAHQGLKPGWSPYIDTNKSSLKSNP